MCVIAGTSTNLIWTRSIAQTATETLRETLSEAKISSEIVWLLHSGQAGLKPKPTPSFPLPIYHFYFLSPAYLAKAKGKAVYLDCRQRRGIWSKLSAVLRAKIAFGRQCTYVALTMWQAMVEALRCAIAHLILTTK